MPVSLQDPDSQGREKHANIVIKRRAARHQCLKPAAETGLHFAPHQSGQHSVGDPFAEAQPGRVLVALAAQRDGLVEQCRFLAAGLADAASYAVVHDLI